MSGGSSSGSYGSGNQSGESSPFLSALRGVRGRPVLAVDELEGTDTGGSSFSPGGDLDLDTDSDVSEGG